ncbi:hypothetical protein AB0O07_14485 [Streptomyces sp. NPDC093085]|uniref:hypothetical protein n=1 Tax=Streptomyces sp. NPDC093085 TaxID=3155068 RepID=UPI0034287CE1
MTGTAPAGPARPSPAGSGPAGTAPVPSRRRSPGVVGAELRRGIGPWAGLVVLGLCWFVLLPRLSQWQGHWPQTGNLLRPAGVLFGGPVAVALGCRQGGRERRARTEELLASLPRGPLRRALLAVAPAAFWPAAGYLVAVAGCALVTWPYASTGGPFLSLIGADAVALASLGVLGFVGGRLAGTRFAAPVLAAVAYAVLALPLYLGHESFPLGPAAQHWYAWDRPVWWYGPASMLWTAGLAGAALLALAARRRTLALLPLVAACAAAVVLVRTGEGVWRPDPAAARLVCDDGTPQVCLTAVDRKLLPSVSAALTGVNARLRGVPGAPVRWADGPSARGRDVRTGREGAWEAQLPQPFQLSERGRVSDPAYFANWAASNLLSQDCPDASGKPYSEAARRADAVTDAVVRWLAPPTVDLLGPPDEAAGHLRRLHAMDPGESRAYLARFLAADSCRPAEVPVP